MLIRIFSADSSGYEMFLRLFFTKLHSLRRANQASVKSHKQIFLLDLKEIAKIKGILK